MHEPLFLENPGQKTIVIFIHGFMGSPRNFDRIAKAAGSRGYSAASLLLPGHGSSVKVFSKSTMEEWQKHVDDEIERYSKKYSEVHLVGHSMGCLLSLNAAIRNGTCIRSLFLCAAPLKLSLLSGKYLKIGMRILLSRKKDPVKSGYYTASGIDITPSLVWRVFPPFFQLVKLQRAVKENLNKIHIPVTAAFSSNDEIIHMKSAEILETGLQNAPLRTLLLKESLHVLYTEKEQVIIDDALFDLIKRSGSDC